VFIIFLKFQPSVSNDTNYFLVNLTPSYIIGFKITWACRLLFLLIYVQQVSRENATACNETIYAAVNSLTLLQVMINDENQRVLTITTVSQLREHSSFLASHIHLSSFIPYPL
jgi:hypothetical protein